MAEPVPIPPSTQEGKIVPILAGGGTRLPAHVGILTGLNELGLSFTSIVGVSGGSIVAALYALGKSVSELKKLVLNVNFQQFKGQSLMNLIRSGGLSNGSIFEKWLDNELGGVYFKDLTTDLHIVATDVVTSQPVIFNAQTTPDLKVSRAVLFSISIPLIFSFQHFDEHILVDGSILSEDALYRDWAGDGTPVVCFRLRSQTYHKKISSNPSFLPIKDYLSMLIRTFMTTLSREYINDSFWQSTVIVNTGSYSPVEFNLTNDDKICLFQMGYKTVMDIVPLKLHQTTNHHP